ncbi:hypothetical protein CRX72_27615 [Pantoea sp. BRM17]|nr:hypothetical protein CRX72_27615 [Pantoea sp. BRM17]
MLSQIQVMPLNSLSVTTQRLLKRTGQRLLAFKMVFQRQANNRRVAVFKIRNTVGQFFPANITRQRFTIIAGK